jgi:hypothetical protein
MVSACSSIDTISESEQNQEKEDELSEVGVKIPVIEFNSNNRWY